MINAQTGQLARDYYIGAPMDVQVSVGASLSGQEYMIVPVGTCSFEAISTCPGTTPGDVVALTLSQASTSASVSTATSTTTVVSTSTTTAVSVSTTSGPVSTTTVVSTSGSGVSSTALYGVAAVAVIFIIATGYLAMRGRKPAS